MAKNEMKPTKRDYKAERARKALAKEASEPSKVANGRGLIKDAEASPIHHLHVTPDVINILRSIDARLERIESMGAAYPKTVRTEIESYLKKESLHTPPKESKKTSSIYTANGVTLGASVWVVYIAEKGEGKSRLYSGTVTALTLEEVTVHVQEDDSEVAYPVECVFLKNEEGAIAANDVLQNHLAANMAVRGDRARIVVELLSVKRPSLDQLKGIPHRELMSALSLVGVTNFKLGALKGEERLHKIAELVMEYRKTPESMALLAEQRALAAISERAEGHAKLEEAEAEPKTNGKSVAKKPTDDTPPDAVSESDFIIAGKEWFRVLSIKKNVIFTTHNKTGMKRVFKQPQLKFASFTARKHTPTWEVA